MRDDLRLDADGALDELTQRRRAWVERSTGVDLDPIQDLRVGDEAALDDLRQPARQVRSREQSDKLTQVADHSGRWVEGADEVLALAVLIPVLPPTAASTMPSSVVGHLDDA